MNPSVRLGSELLTQSMAASFSSCKRHRGKLWGPGREGGEGERSDRCRWVSLGWKYPHACFILEQEKSGKKTRRKVTERCCRADGGTGNLSVCLSGEGRLSLQPLWCITAYTQMGSPRAWRRESHLQGEKGLGNKETLLFPKCHEADNI